MHKRGQVPCLKCQEEADQAQRNRSPIKRCPSLRFIEIYHTLINSISPSYDCIPNLPRAANHNRHHRDGNSRNIHQLAEKAARSCVDCTCDLRQANGLKVREREFECPKDGTQKEDNRLGKLELAQRANKLCIAT